MAFNRFEYSEPLETGNCRAKGRDQALTWYWKNIYTQWYKLNPPVAMIYKREECDDLKQDLKKIWLFITLRPPNQYCTDTTSEDFEEIVERMKHRSWVEKVVVARWEYKEWDGQRIKHWHALIKPNIRMYPSTVKQCLKRGKNKYLWSNDHSMDVQKINKKDFHRVRTYIMKDDINLECDETLTDSTESVESHG